MHDQNDIIKVNTKPPAVEASSPATLTVEQELVEAINYQSAGRIAEAERLFEKILASSPQNAVATYGFALLRTKQGRWPEAIDGYRHVIAMRPDFADAYTNLGTVLLGLGHREEAVTLYRQAIAINADSVLVYSNLGKALQELGRTDEAMDAFRTGIAQQPDYAAIHVNLGAALLGREAWDDAITVTRRAIVLQPANAMAHANLGTALLRSGRYPEALEACRQAMVLQHQGVAMLASLGGAMLELGALQEAVTLCRQAIALDASQPTAHLNLSHALKGMNRLEEAELAARHAIELCPDCAEHHFHLAHILLLQGDLEGGWREYEWRRKQPTFAWAGDLLEGLSQPMWTGEDIADKTILIFTEQGLGDIIQFARYLPLVARRAGRVIVAANPQMRRLLETIEGITVVPRQETAAQNFDVQCPIMSLPFVFATRLATIPASIPYLRADPVEQARWDARIGGGAMRVGVVWAGNPITPRDRFRSPGFSSVAPLFSVPGVDFVILQVGPGRQDCQASALPPHVIDLGQDVTDLADTAAIMAGLDLMISSCTGPLHLAGALGVPTWAMIPFAPHFPWLLERSDSPWYPTMRLYRQESYGQDWSGVVSRITADLVALCSRVPLAQEDRCRELAN